VNAGRRQRGGCVNTTRSHRAKAFPVPTKKSRSQLFISLFFLGLSKEPVSLQQLRLQIFALFFSPWWLCCWLGDSIYPVSVLQPFSSTWLFPPRPSCPLCLVRTVRLGFLLEGLLRVQCRWGIGGEELGAGRQRRVQPLALKGCNCSPNLLQELRPQEQRQAAAPAL